MNKVFSVVTSLVGQASLQSSINQRSICHMADLWSHWRNFTFSETSKKFSDEDFEIGELVKRQIPAGLESLLDENQLLSETF